MVNYFREHLNPRVYCPKRVTFNYMNNNALLFDIKETVSVLTLIKKRNNKTLRRERTHCRILRNGGPFMCIISACNTLNITVARNEQVYFIIKVISLAYIHYVYIYIYQDSRDVV